MKGDSRRLFAAAIPAVTLLLLLAFVFYLPQVHQTEINLVSEPHRRLLQVEEWDDATVKRGMECGIEDIEVHQGRSGTSPSGISTYTVTVLNLCSVSGGCSLGNIHLSCGAFSSERLVNPSIFRRLRINDCLLNDGRPLASGSVVSFEYASSVSYPLAISNATCAR
ncbi:TPD1 protein homolog 1-like [Curcuma longa]|uniref:TPD1 protein homolog 1-like n=1 Tax=Curcuma longa TaxID=136217 RepID=UPI003D9DB8D6